MHKTSPLIFLFSFCLILSLFAEEASRVENRSIPFGQDGMLAVKADDGEVRIEAWDQESIQLDITYRAWGSTQERAEERLEDLHVEVIENKNRVVVREITHEESENVGLLDVLDSDFWKKKRWSNGQIDFIIKVPEQTRIKMNHDSGPLSITGTKGAIHIEADEGSVTLSNIQAEEILVELDEADVLLEHIKDTQRGLCRISMDEGDIRFTDFDMQSIEVECDEGSITGNQIYAKEFRVQADEGRVDLTIDPQDGGRYAFNTDEGDIELALPSSSSVQLKLWTGEGRIQTNADCPVRRFEDGEQMEGQIGASGSAMLKASTDEGDIRLILE